MVEVTGFDALAVTKITESATNPRKHFDPAALAELTASVRAHGVLSPILVRPRPKGRYELVAGARRLRAAVAAGLDTIPAVVRELDDKAALEVQVIENLQRADLSPLEEARGYQLLHEQHGYAVDELAAKVGKSKAYVYGRMKLCALPKGAQKLLDEGQLDASRALLVARIPVPALAEKAAREIAYGTWMAGDIADGHKPDKLAKRPEPMSYRDAVEHVQSTYMLRLDQAPFATGDAALLPAAGACGACPKRTGNQLDLFGDVARADVCTDPVCYGGKVDAWFARRAAEVEAKGGTVLEGKAAMRVPSYGGPLVRLDDRCIDDPKNRTWRRLLGKAAQDLALTLVRREDRIEERVDRAAALRIAKAAGKIASRADARAADPNARREAARKAAHQQRLATVCLVRDELLAAAANVSDDEVLRYVIADLAASHRETAQKVFARLGVDVSDGRMSYDNRHQRERDLRRAAIAEMKHQDLVAIAIELIACDRPSANWGDGYSEAWTAACNLVGLDLAAAEKRAAAVTPAKKQRGRAKPAEVDDEEDGEDEDLELDEEERSCRVCGCTEDHACDGGCSWVEDDLCSSCVEPPASPKPKKRNAARRRSGQ